MSSDGPIDLEDLVITAYCALDDALKHAGIANNKGKFIPRRGPPPEVDDREVLCLCLLQEWLGFDSDLSFFLETSFRGCLLADNGYWPKPDKRTELEEHGISVIACTRSNQKFHHTKSNAALLKKHRPHIERFIGLFDQQFNATRTQCRNIKNYVARRWIKAFAHNASRFINKENEWPMNSMAHMRKVS